MRTQMMDDLQNVCDKPIVLFALFSNFARQDSSLKLFEFLTQFYGIVQPAASV